MRRPAPGISIDPNDVPAPRLALTAMATPAVDIVIVSFNCRELLSACLDSIARSPTYHGEVWAHVVDNASTDGTPAMLRDSYPQIRTRALGENAGFSAGNNIALRECTAPWVLVLNPDAELRDGVLDHLLDVVGEQPDIGMIGCRLEQPDGTFDHAAKRSFPTPLAAIAHFTKLGRRSAAGAAMAQYRAPTVDEHGMGDVDAVNGAFMLVRREAMEQVGLFDEGYWLYMEDLDWCRRFHDAGWRVVYDGRVTAMHVKGGAAGKVRAPKQNIAFHRGMGRFYRRHEAGKRPLLDWAVFSGILLKLGLSLARGVAVRRGL